MKEVLTIIFIMCATFAYSQTISEVRNELHRQGVPCVEIVLAQARLETGNFTSSLCRSHHNLFGIKHNGRYAHYANWKDSITDYKKRISSRYNGGSYYAFLVRIKYASDPKYIAKLKQF